MVHGQRNFSKYIPFIVWSAAVIATDVLARYGVIPTWVFYVLLVVMHLWIFTRIGIKVYNRNRKQRQ